jgi:hypothetical protein
VRWPLPFVLLGLLDPAAAAADCTRSPTWDKLVRCQIGARKHEIVKDMPDAKLVSFDTSRPDRPSQQLALYAFSGGTWSHVGFHVELNATNELLDVQRIAPATVKVVLGYSTPSWITVDEVTNRPALLRRTFTYVCQPTRLCLQTLTSCEVLVHGKTIASFRGEAIWNGLSLRLRADTRNTNRYCTPPHNLVDEPAG